MRECFVTDIPHSLFEGNVCVIMCGMEVILKNVIDLVSIPIFLEPRKFQFSIEKKLIQGYLVAKACYQLQYFKNYWACEKILQHNFIQLEHKRKKYMLCSNILFR